MIFTSNPQPPFKTPQIPSNGDHEGLNRGTLGVLGIEEPDSMGGVGTGPCRSRGPCHLQFFGIACATSDLGPRPRPRRVIYIRYTYL